MGLTPPSSVRGSQAPSHLSIHSFTTNAQMEHLPRHKGEQSHCAQSHRRLNNHAEERIAGGAEEACSEADSLHSSAKAHLPSRPARGHVVSSPWRMPGCFSFLGAFPAQGWSSGPFPCSPTLGFRGHSAGIHPPSPPSSSPQAGTSLLSRGMSTFPAAKAAP